MSQPANVAVYIDANLSYPKENFDPPETYPEYPHRHLKPNLANKVYPAIRQIFRQLKLDEANYGTPEWNPLGESIHRGDKVVIKPNFVTHQHPGGQQHLKATITNASFLRTVLDYAIIAAGPEGRIDVVDGPLDMADLKQALEVTGADRMFEDLRTNKGLNIPIIDLRKWSIHWEGGNVLRFDLPGDPRGYVTADLCGDSELLREVNASIIDKYRSTASFFQKNRMQEWHNTEHNYYSFSKTVMEADVFINLPKMKTHKKGGVTLCLKNIVGVTDAKDTLPHHRVGSPFQGGDEFPDGSSSRMKLKAFLVDKIFSNPQGLAAYKLIKPLYNRLRSAGLYGRIDQRDRGEWYGNDTIWRTVLDLNKVLLYADGEGKLHETRQRRYFSLVDGIVAGEHNGPLRPTAVDCGCLVAGSDPVAVDLACVRLMGLDWQKIPTYAHVKNINRYRIGSCDTEKIQICANDPAYNDIFASSKQIFSFKVPDGWTGAIEL